MTYLQTNLSVFEFNIESSQMRSLFLYLFIYFIKHVREKFECFPAKMKIRWSKEDMNRNIQTIDRVDTGLDGSLVHKPWDSTSLKHSVSTDYTHLTAE